MEFISAKDFLKQDKEVQEVLTKYWLNIVNPKIGFCKKHDEIIFINGETRKDRYPLFTEGQLRQFIEDKAECRLSIEYKLCSNSYVIKLINLKTGGCSIIFDDICHSNLLQAYWKVACEIAKESLK